MPNSIQELTVTGWKLNFTMRKMLFSQKMIQQGIELLDQWQVAFPKEETWVQKKIGIPSLIVRFDCIGGGNGHIYEIEERPSGVGVSQMISPLFQKNLKRLSKDWPEYDVVISGNRVSCDDHLCGKRIMTIEEAKNSESLLLVRAEPVEKDFDCFESRSISSLRQKGNKSYGVNLGLWKKVSSVENLPWEDGFALKPLQGSKCRGVEIWTPHRVNGKSTRTRIERILKQYGSMYCQPLIYPLNSGIEEFPCMIYRVFFGYNIASAKWECMGGLWMARPNLKIHGATDSLVGPVTLG